MAWPPTPASGTAFQSTSTTVQWGTAGILSTYIVKTIRARDINEVLYIENGTGLRSIRIQLWQGREVDITVVADSGFTHPSPEATVTVIDPLSGTSIAFKVIANEFNAQRKQEGERVISAVYDTAIEGSGTPPTV